MIIKVRRWNGCFSKLEKKNIWKVWIFYVNDFKGQKIKCSYFGLTFEQENCHQYRGLDTFYVRSSFLSNKPTMRGREPGGSDNLMNQAPPPPTKKPTNDHVTQWMNVGGTGRSKKRPRQRERNVREERFVLVASSFFSFSLASSHSYLHFLQGNWSLLFTDFFTRSMFGSGAAQRPHCRWNSNSCCKAFVRKMEFCCFVLWPHKTFVGAVPGTFRAKDS